MLTATCYGRRKWQPTPVFLFEESQGLRSLVGCRLWSRTELDTTEVTQQQQQLPVTIAIMEEAALYLMQDWVLV